MPKPMGSECEGVLISSLLLLNFPLLLQLGTDATSYYGTIPVEGVALRYLINSLQSSGITSVQLNWYCSNDMHDQIYCSCDNKTRACSIVEIDLSDNQLQGVIPLSLSNLRSLEKLNLSRNMLTGSIPASLTSMRRLRELTLDDNNLEGNLPKELGSLVNLTDLYLTSNKFNGSIPDTYSKLVNLKTFAVGGNNLSGPIPNYVGEWINLTSLILLGNNFYGNLPPKTFTLPKLRTLLVSDVSNPGISLPDDKNISESLAIVVMRNCKINGSIPENIGEGIGSYIFTRPGYDRISTKMSFLADNSLFINSGGEEVRIGKDHYHNDTSTASFNRSPSEDWAYSFSGDYFWATINNSTLVRNSTCEVSSPEAKLQNNFRLAPVSLTYYGLCLRKGTYFVTLHFAETLYSKEEDNSRVGKRVFDVYIQKQNVMKDLNIKEIPGEQNEERKLRFPTTIHDGSLEIQFFWAGKGSLYNPPAINGPLVSAISVTRAVVFCFQSSQKTTSLGNRGNYSKLYFVSASAVGRYVENGLDRRQRITRGRSGIVYKGELPGLTVAVKKLFSRSKAVDEIAREVYAKKVLDLKHENLVPLLATYSKNQLHLLIYEYMEHGSLKQALFDSNSTVDLNWENRYNICWGIAKGLKHLHEKEPQIIHRNIKSTNILLGNCEGFDAKCNAKISDFGLAKFYEEESQYNIMQAGGDA
ncbi:unnamed protein product [Dovyalis caffra]|uniref:non-specific serine/threonine protein kinase n=1 Tax=Dovyalis caffra TaxID=77055 RepID=A0AAV1RHW6_9ROSI|nr:unnamed protein product [Dovyalis caffra]